MGNDTGRVQTSMIQIQCLLEFYLQPRVCDKQHYYMLENHEEIISYEMRLLSKWKRKLLADTGMATVTKMLSSSPSVHIPAVSHGAILGTNGPPTMTGELLPS